MKKRKENLEKTKHQVPSSIASTCSNLTKTTIINRLDLFQCTYTNSIF